MAENFDIVINDKVDSGISTKLDSIANSADNADNALTRLKASLALINSSPLQVLQNAANQCTNAINQNALANQRLSTEQQRTAVTAAKVATEQQKTAIAAQRLSIEEQRTVTATAQAAAAQDRAAIAAIRLAEAQDRAAKGAHRHGQGFLAMAGSMAVGMLTAQAIMAVIHGITGAITGGIDAVEEYQQSVIQMSAILTSLAKNQTDIAGTYQQAHKYAEGLNLTLEQVDAKTSLNLMNLQSITQEMAKQGITLKTNNEGQVESFTRLANAVAVYSRNGKDERQVRQEVAALLRGEVKQGDELAKLMDRLTNGHLKQYMAQWKQTDTVLGEVGKRLSGFGPAAEELNGTWSAATSSIKTSLNIISRAGLTAVVADMVGYIQQANGWLRENSSIIGSNIAVGWLAVKGIVSSIWDVLKMIGRGIDLIVTGSLNSFVGMLTKSEGKFTSMWGIFKEIIRGVAFTASVLLPTLIEKFVDVVKVASGIVIVAVEFGNVMFAAIKGVAASLVDIGVGLWKGLTGDIDGMKEEFGKIFSGAVAEAFRNEVTYFKGTLGALKDDVKNLFSTAGLDARLDKFFAADRPKPKTATDAQPPLLTPPVPTVDKNAEKRETALEKINAELERERRNMFLLKDAREIQNKLDQIEINFAAKKWSLSQSEIDTIRQKLVAIENNKRVQKEFDSIYERSTGPLKDYNAAQEAAKKLLDQGSISAEQYNRALLLAKNTFEDVAKPLIAINRELDQQANLLNFVGEQQLLAQQMQQYTNELRQKGFVLTEKENSAISAKVRNLIRERSINQELSSIYDSTLGKEKQLTDQLEALNKAYQKGYISEQAYKRSKVQNSLDRNNLNIDNGKGNFLDAFKSGASSLLNGYKNAVASMRDMFTDLFQTIGDGFANSIGRAIVYGDNLKESFANVGKEILSGLISSLIKLGVQYAINATLGASFAAAATAGSVAQAAVISSAWAPAAAMVSLATEGANAIPASVGMVETVGLSRILAMPGFESGGYTGNLGTKDIAGIVHGQEFVVNARGTANNRELLEAINRGESVSTSTSSTSTKGGSSIKVEVYNYGTSKQFEVEQISADQVRIIARDEAKQAVYAHSPKAVASQISDPNSVVSKSLERNTQTQRKR